MWNELFTYDMLAMVSWVRGERGWHTSDGLLLHVPISRFSSSPQLASFFRDVPTGTRRFFSSPPYSFGLAATSVVGYLVAFEWVGKILASVVSEPFFLGSSAHKAAIARLPGRDFASDAVHVHVDVGVGVWPATPSSPPSVVWRIEAPLPGAPNCDSKFFKIIRGDGFDALFLRRVHNVYAVLAAAYHASTGAGSRGRPSAIVDAQLLYGAGELCVLMPWVGGRDALPAELGDGGCAVEPVAEAILWLAHHGLLYVDLREPNVRVTEVAAATGVASSAGQAGVGAVVVALVDYDDCVVLPQPPASADELIALLAVHEAAFAGAGLPGARPAVVAALRRLWWHTGPAPSAALSSGEGPLE
jgi:hypothetical protein